MFYYAIKANFFQKVSAALGLLTSEFEKFVFWVTTLKSQSLREKICQIRPNVQNDFDLI
jgi:hypothetical protein